MKKFLVINALILLITLPLCSFTAASDIKMKELDSNIPVVETSAKHEAMQPLAQIDEPEEKEEIFIVEKLTKFVDKNLKNYTYEELENLIETYKTVKSKANYLMLMAIDLGWPETSTAIQNAKVELHNADLAIKVYELQKLKTPKFSVEAARSEYPAATEIWLFMKELGWNDYVCAGIMGNLMAEVGGNTLDIQYWLYNSSNEYYGMCQWNKVYKTRIWDGTLLEQCNFLRDTIKYEIDTFGKLYEQDFNFNSFLALEDEQDAALAFAKAYERCSSKHYKVRQDNAEIAYKYFAGD